MQTKDTKQPLYVSLTGPLLGAYLRVEGAPSNHALRIAMNHSVINRAWCGVYTERQMQEIEPVYGPPIVIDKRFESIPYSWNAYCAACETSGIEPD